MKVKKIAKGMLSANCYILYKDSEAVVIDPGVKAKVIIEFLKENKLSLKYIIFTHGHIDHILYAKELKNETNAEIVVHYLDNELLVDSYKNGAYLFGLNNKFENGDILVRDGDQLIFSNIKLDIIFTPGHTPGGICIRYKEQLFSGDTLFYMSIGRTDLGMGDHEQLIDSIKNKLFVLSDSTIVYPGHGKNTTIGDEKRENLYIV